MFDQETWRFINTFAPWLSALGTLTAVIVSLYLARRASRLDVRVFPGIVTLLTPGQPNAERPEFIQVRAVNHGRSAVVSGVGWWRLRGIWKKKNWLALPPDNPYTTRLPKRLEFGEEAAILFPTATFYRDGNTILEDIRSARFPSLRVRLMRIGVFTSTGQQFRVPLDVHLCKFLLERASQLPPAPNR